MRTFSALIYTLSSIANGKRFGDTMYRTVLCWPSNKQNGSLLGHNSLLMGVHPSAVVGVERHFHRASARIHRADWKQEDPCRSKRNHGKARKEKESWITRAICECWLIDRWIQYENKPIRIPPPPFFFFFRSTTEYLSAWYPDIFLRHNPFVE